MLADIAVFQTSEQVPNMYSSVPSNTMGRYKHFICHVTSSPVLPAKLFRQTFFKPSSRTSSFFTQTTQHS